MALRKVRKILEGIRGVEGKQKYGAHVSNPISNWEEGVSSTRELRGWGDSNGCKQPG